MANIVNVAEFTKRFALLGWTNLSLSDVLDGIAQQNIPAPSLIAYLDALIATPAGVNDQSIANCSAANATKITAYLKAKSFVSV